MTPREGAALGGTVGTALGFVFGIGVVAIVGVRSDSTAGGLMLAGIVAGAIGGAVVGAGSPSGTGQTGANVNDKPVFQAAPARVVAQVRGKVAAAA